MIRKCFRMAVAMLLYGVAAAAAAGTLPEPLRLDDYAAIATRAKQTPMVIMLWEIACEFCKSSMLLLDKLRAQSTQPEFVLISVDTPDRADAVGSTLQRIGMDDARSFIFADAHDWLRHEIDPDWRGELPRTYLFDGRGRVEVRSGLLHETDLRRWWSALAP